MKELTVILPPIYEAGDLEGRAVVAMISESGLPGPQGAQGPPGVDAISNLGKIPQDPIILAPVDVVQSHLDGIISATYDQPNESDGVGATLTHAVNGVLVLDSVYPTVDQRVVVNNVAYGGATVSGIYTVTDVGSETTPWILTRATDCDTADILGSYWTCFSKGFANPYGGPVNTDVQVFSHPVYGEAVAPWDEATFAVGSDGCNIFVERGGPSIYRNSGSRVLNSRNWAYGLPVSEAYGYQSTSLGGSAGGDRSLAGADGIANGSGSFAFCRGVAYDHGAYAHGAISSNFGADGQFIRIVGSARTQGSGGTTAKMQPSSRMIRFVDEKNLPFWKYSFIVRGRVIARRYNTNLTAAWQIATPGILVGNGSNDYVWVGGSAPTFSLIGEDVGMGGSVTISVDDNAGAKALSINVNSEGYTGGVGWIGVLELDEIIF